MITIVIHRFGKEIVGGAEHYAYELAKILSKYTQVEIVTTTARDHNTWEPFYSEGTSFEEGLIIKRFHTNFVRDSYWKKLHRILEQSDPKNLPLSFCYEWLIKQGPYSTDLLHYLRTSSADRYIFFTYLYPTTFFGIDEVSNASLISTYHDESPLYLPIFQKYANYPHLFLTKEEKRLAQKVIQPKIAHLLGYGVKEQSVQPKEGNYFVYVGRIESAKGIDELIEYHQRFYQKHKIPLYLIGKGERITKEGIVYKGYLSEKEKLAYMKGAKALIHPSAHESLAIVLLEAFSQKTPVVVTSKSEVLSDHVKESQGGLIYYDYPSYENALLSIKRHFGYYGYDYFKKYYSYEVFQRRLYKLLISKDEDE